jgi:putative SOS response-associated peptidase YedK
MCWRFVQRYTWDDVQDLYDLSDGPARNLQAHYNVAPTDPVNVVKLTTGGATELVSIRWGLIPWWCNKPLKQVPASFNARAETVADKPMFRDAFARHRCIIPALAIMNGSKSRMAGSRISSARRTAERFAGLWDRWKS